MGRCPSSRFNIAIASHREEHIGFTAIVNKLLSAKYETLVNNAPELIKVLPWGPDFEVDVFRKPDFTALEVVTFATGGTRSQTVLLNLIKRLL